VRDAADFAGAHLADSLNIGLGGKFATWAGTLLDRQKPIVLIAEPGREVEAATRLGRIGFDEVAGYLADGMAALRFRPDLVQRGERITAQTLLEQLDSPATPLVVDVRSEKEWQAHRIEGSVNIPLPHLRERVNEVPRDRLVVVHCASGYRSSTALSILAQQGYTNVADLVGGMAAWDQADAALQGAGKP
jgi:rhodanese-related sulfurtransferase